MTTMDENRLYFIFDLDDTLFQEMDFLVSGYKYILQSFPVTEERSKLLQEMIHRYHLKEDVFEWLVDIYAKNQIIESKDNFIKQYREHQPNILLREGAIEFIIELQKRNIPIGLITDGRSITQRNKLSSWN